MEDDISTISTCFKSDPGRKAVFISILILLLPARINKTEIALGRLIVWNVGQGQWLTIIAKESCYHLDMGGERHASQRVHSLCRNRKNRLYISHPDWDHINQIKKFQRHHANLCYGNLRSLKKRFLRKELIALPKLPECASEALPGPLTEIIPNQSSRTGLKKKNDRSLVFLIKNQILVTGDSPEAAEKIWLHQISHLHLIKQLVLGHHGSQTSTSRHLLLNLPSLRQAIASARSGKYGHPHFIVSSRLQTFGVALLTTEQWGDIEIRIYEE